MNPDATLLFCISLKHHQLILDIDQIEPLRDLKRPLLDLQNVPVEYVQFEQYNHRNEPTQKLFINMSKMVFQAYDELDLPRNDEYMFYLHAIHTTAVSLLNDYSLLQEQWPKIDRMIQQVRRIVNVTKRYVPDNSENINFMDSLARAIHLNQTA